MRQREQQPVKVRWQVYLNAYTAGRALPRPASGERMPEPAAVALVDAGLVPEKAQQALEAMLKSIDGAYLSFKPKKRGRPPAHLQQILIDSLGATYFDLTGKRPTVSTMNSKASGIFYNFTLKMLQAMRPEKIFKPEYEVRRLCQVWRKRRPSAAI